MLGPDVGNGNQAQLTQFRSTAHVTFPLLLTCADGPATADSNLLKSYNERDNYVVINKQGIIRYHADDFWDYGNRYHKDELRGTIDSLVTQRTGVDDPRAHVLSLSASPNPFRRLTTIEFSNPMASGTHTRVTVLDLAGRRVATLWDAPARSGVTRLGWEGRTESDRILDSGVYLVRADIGSKHLTRRLVFIR